MLVMHLVTKYTGMINHIVTLSYRYETNATIIIPSEPRFVIMMYVMYVYNDNYIYVCIIHIDMCMTGNYSE